MKKAAKKEFEQFQERNICEKFIINGSTINSIIRNIILEKSNISVPGFRPGKAPISFILPRLKLEYIYKLYQESVNAQISSELSAKCKERNWKIFLYIVEECDANSVWSSFCTSEFMPNEDVLNSIKNAKINAIIRIFLLQEDEKLFIDESAIKNIVADSSNDSDILSNAKTAISDQTMPIPLTENQSLTGGDILSVAIRILNSDGLLIFDGAKDITLPVNQAEWNTFHEKCIKAPNDNFAKIDSTNFKYVSELLSKDINFREEFTVKIKLLGKFRKQSLSNFQEICSALKVAPEEFDVSLVAEAKKKIELASSAIIRCHIVQQMLKNAETMLDSFHGFESLKEISIVRPLPNLDNSVTKKKLKKTEDKDLATPAPEAKVGRKSSKKKNVDQDDKISASDAGKEVAEIPPTISDDLKNDIDIKAATQRGLALMYIAEQEILRRGKHVNGNDTAHAISIMAKKYNIDIGMVQQLLSVYPALKIEIRRDAAIRRAILEIEKSVKNNSEKVTLSIKQLEDNVISLPQEIRPIEWTLY